MFIESTGVKLLNYSEGNMIFAAIQDNIPFGSDDRVDFSKFKAKYNIVSISCISELIKKSTEFYVMWDNLNLPCLKSELNDIIRYIDDVTAVGFDTWVVSSEYNIVIEFHHEGDIVLGFLHE